MDVMNGKETCEGCLFWLATGDGYCTNPNNDPAKNKGRYVQYHRYDRCEYFRANLQSRAVMALEAIAEALRRNGK